MGKTITKVYEYGLLRPRDPNQLKLIDQQLWLGHRYRNDLIEVLRARRAVHRQVVLELGQLGPQLDDVIAARNAFEQAQQLVRDKRKKSRSRSEQAEDRERIVQAKTALAEARDVFHKQRKATKPQWQHEVDLLSERWCAMRRSLRHHYGPLVSGLRFGSYQLIEASVDQSNKAMSLWAEDENPVEPRFRAWRCTGQLSEQVQGGVSAAQLFSGGSKQVQVDPIDERAWCGASRPERRRASYSVLRLRMGLDEKRQLIWAEWPIEMHRPLPDSYCERCGKQVMAHLDECPTCKKADKLDRALIMRATVSKRLIGPRESWKVQFTVRMPQYAPVRPRRCMNVADAVALDVGWRLLQPSEMGQREIRVGSWLGSDGARGELRLDAKLISVLRYHEQLRSIRDKRLEHLRRWLCAWRRKRRDELPQWLLKATRRMHSWRAARRFAALCRRWRRELGEHDKSLVQLTKARAALERVLSGDKLRGRARRNPLTPQQAADNFEQARAAFYEAVQGSEAPFPRVLEIFEAWRYRDHHLWSWESSKEKKALRRRRDLYRVFAAEMSDRYHTLVLEDFDLRRVARRKPTESEEADNTTAMSNRQLVSISELRLVLTNAFGGAGGQVVKVPPENTTRICSRCGQIDTWDQAAELMHLCSRCGADNGPWDQDENAADNILARWREQCGGNGKRRTARKSQKPKNNAGEQEETRRQRMRRQHKERQDRITAREQATEVPQS